MKQWLYIATFFLSSLSFGQMTKQQMINEFESWFFGSEQSELRSYTSTNGTDEGNLYFQMKATAAGIHAFMGSGDVRYLDEVLWHMELAKENARPSSEFYNDCRANGGSVTACWNDSYLTWVDKPGWLVSTARNDDYRQRPLMEMHGMRIWAKILWVLYASPNLRAATYNGVPGYYGAKYQELLDFYIRNVWEKWTNRNEIQAGQTYRSTTHITSHYAYMSFFLWKITGQNRFYEPVRIWATNMSEGDSRYNGSMLQNIRLQSSTDSYNWSNRWGTQSGTTDHHHANAEIELMTELYHEGLFFTAQNGFRIDRLINILLNNVLALDTYQQNFAPYYINGALSTNSNLVSRERENKQNMRGIHLMGMFSEALMTRLENRNMTNDNASYQHGLFWGYMIFNRAYLDGTIQYPEIWNTGGGQTGYAHTFYSGTSTTTTGACAITTGSTTLYSPSSSLGIGSTLYTDAALTTLYNGGNNYIKSDTETVVYRVSSSGSITAESTCNTGTGGGGANSYAFYGGSAATATESCALNSGSTIFYSSSNALDVGIQLFLNTTLATPLNGANNYFKSATSSVVYQVDASGFITDVRSCGGQGETGNDDQSLNTLRRKVKNIVYPFTG